MVASSLGVGDPKGEVQRPRDLTVNSATSTVVGPRTGACGLTARPSALAAATEGGHRPPTLLATVEGALRTCKAGDQGMDGLRRPPPTPDGQSAGRPGQAGRLLGVRDWAGYLQVPALSSRHQANGLRALMRGVFSCDNCLGSSMAVRPGEPARPCAALR